MRLATCLHCKVDFDVEKSIPRSLIYCSKKCRGKHSQKAFRARRRSGVEKQKKSEKWIQAVVSPRRRAIQVEYKTLKRDHTRSRWAKGMWKLTRADFEKVIFSKCKYCGCAPSKRTRTGGLLRNGIDRMNNKLGYTVANSAPCCSACNRMKFKMSVREFLSQIKKIHDYQNDSTRKS